MEFGIQMFGYSKICKENPEAFFAKVAECGCRQIEPDLVLGDMGVFAQNFWTIDDFTKYAPLMKKYDLEIISCHLFSREPMEYMAELIQVAKTYEFKQYVMGMPRVITKEDLEAGAQRYIAIAEKLAAENIELLVHNGSKEVSEKIDGVSALEWFLHRCGGKVFSQVDTGWMLYGGENPANFMERNSEYIHSLHYKDMHVPMSETKDRPRDVGLGNGDLEVLPCFQYALTHCIPQIIDQDNSEGDMLDDLTISIKLLRSCEEQKN